MLHQNNSNCIQATITFSYVIFLNSQTAIDSVPTAFYNVKHFQFTELFQLILFVKLKSV